MNDAAKCRSGVAAIMASIKESAEKPDIHDFKLGQQLGEGNFSRIMLATHVATNEVFALKVIEKQRIKRLRVRHPNIFNEINMEKQVLNKLRHPNIVRLYHTFQDESSLYFLLEYIEGGELLNRLVQEGNQIGVHEQLARFYLADIVNAIEYMHVNAVIHRDLKPENIVVSAIDGHLKVIDFGTAKDVGEPALNGPPFVGTPEYMSPETVDNKETGYPSDIWALGCIAFQLMAGETPFSGGSAYLTFLKVQVGRYHLPSFLSDASQDLIQRCLSKNPASRPTIEDIKAHPFFAGIDFATHASASPPPVQFQNSALFEVIKDLQEAEKQRVPHQSLPPCFTDGVQQRIAALCEQDKSLLKHLLDRRQLLHLPSIYPRFFTTPSLGRCLYARHGGYVGCSHALQNQWSDKFSFMMICGPSFDRAVSWDVQAREFRRRVIDPINEQLPAFIIVCGDLLNGTTSEPDYASRAEMVRLLLNEVHAEIRLVFAAGINTFPAPLSANDCAIYSSQFGEDRFSFWHGGIKFIVINSSLILHEAAVPSQANEQQEWLIKELENGKLCAKETVLVSAHAFHTLTQGPELPPHLAVVSSTKSDNNNPKELSDTQKKRLVEIVAKHPPCLIVSTQGQQDSVVTVHTAVDPNASSEDDAVPVTKKTQMIVCSSPLSTTKETVLHVAHVDRSGITLTHTRVAPTKPKLEIHEAALSADVIKLELSRGETPTSLQAV